MEEENFFRGMFWAAFLGIPLWIAFFGWLKLFQQLLATF